MGKQITSVIISDICPLSCQKMNQLHHKTIISFADDNPILGLNVCESLNYQFYYLKALYSCDIICTMRKMKASLYQ